LGETHYNSMGYSNMFFYSLFESLKYEDREDTALSQPIRLEFRGFHNIMLIAHYLSGNPDELRTPGQIFKHLVDMHMKDVHFFVHLAYKTSGNLPHNSVVNPHATSTEMVRKGASIEQIIQQVREEDKKTQTRVE